MNCSSKPVHRDERGVIINYSQEVKKVVSRVRTAICWADDGKDEIKIYGADEERTVLVVQIKGAYFLVRVDTTDEPCFFEIRKSRDPRFFLMDPGEVIPWAELFVAGVPAERASSLIWTGAIMMVPVRSMPPAKSEQTVSMKTGFSSRAMHGGQQISISGTLVKRWSALEWFIDGRIEIVSIDHHQGQQPASFSGKYKIVVGERGDATGVQNAAHPPF